MVSVSTQFVGRAAAFCLLRHGGCLNKSQAVELAEQCCGPSEGDLICNEAASGPGGKKLAQRLFVLTIP